MNTYSSLAFEYMKHFDKKSSVEFVFDELSSVLSESAKLLMEAKDFHSAFWLIHPYMDVENIRTIGLLYNYALCAKEIGSFDIAENSYYSIIKKYLACLDLDDMKRFVGISLDENVLSAQDKKCITILKSLLDDYKSNNETQKENSKKTKKKFFSTRKSHVVSEKNITDNDFLCKLRNQAKENYESFHMAKMFRDELNNLFKLDYSEGGNAIADKLIKLWVDKMSKKIPENEYVKQLLDYFGDNCSDLSCISKFELIVNEMFKLSLERDNF